MNMNINNKSKITLKEFEKEYCLLCGTQRCGGVYDEVFREGCEHYNKIFNSNSSPTIKEFIKESNIKGEILWK